VKQDRVIAEHSVCNYAEKKNTKQKATKRKTDKNREY